MNRTVAVKPCALIVLSTVVGLLVIAHSGGAGPLPPAQTIFCADGKKIVQSGDEQLLFYDSFEESARLLARIDCGGQAVTASKQGKLVALCSRFIDATGPVRIFDSEGKQVGEFDVEFPWKVAAISDSGLTIALNKQLTGLSPLVVRLCDLRGKVLRDYGEVTRIRFASDGAPVVWGVHLATRRAFISVLNNRGEDIAGYQDTAEDNFIYDVAPSAKASIVGLTQGPRSDAFPDRVTIWATVSGTRRTVALDKDLGTIQSAPSMSPNGVYMALRLGGTGIAVIRCSDATVHLTADLTSSLATAKQISKILDVTISDDASFTIRYQLPGGTAMSAPAWADFDRQGNFVRERDLPAAMH